MQAKQIHFERGGDPKDVLQIGDVEGRIFAKAKAGISKEMSRMVSNYGGTSRIYKLREKEGIRGSWNPGRGYRYVIDFSNTNEGYYYFPEKYTIGGEWCGTYGGRKSAREAADELIAQWGGKIEEALDFERGMDPKDTMKIGLFKWRNIDYENILTCKENFVLYNGNLNTIWNEFAKNFLKGQRLVVKGVEWFSDSDRDKEKTSKLQISYFVIDANGRTVDSGVMKGTIEKFNQFFNLTDNKSLEESLNFERGMEPKRAMEIGKRRNDLFNKIQSISFINAMKTFPELGSDSDKKILSLAAHMLKVPEGEVRIAMDDKKDVPIYSDNSLMDEFLGRDWEYGIEGSVTSRYVDGSIAVFDLISSSTGEIYVKDSKSDEFLYILGTTN